jgi:hypothetical protein
MLGNPSVPFSSLWTAEKDESSWQNRKDVILNKIFQETSADLDVFIDLKVKSSVKSRGDRLLAPENPKKE